MTLCCLFRTGVDVMTVLSGFVIFVGAFISGWAFGKERGRKKGFDAGLNTKYPDLEQPCGGDLNPHQYGPWREWGTWIYGVILSKTCKRCGWEKIEKTHAAERW